MADQNKIHNLLLEGKRIYLRKIRLSDVTEAYCRWMNDTEVVRYLETRFVSRSQEQIEAYVKHMEKDPDSVFMAIIAKDQDRHMGNIKIGPINKFHRFAKIGMVIGEKAYWGKGYATESVVLAVPYAFNTLHLH